MQVRLRILCALLMAIYLACPPTSAPAQDGYSFTPLAYLGASAPGGGQFTFDFEPYGLNNRGEVAFAADVTTGGEGVFLWRNGQLSQIVRSGQPAPGGGTFNFFGVWSFTALNDPGDVAFTFGLDPFTYPLGMNSGVYRYSSATRTVSAVMVPGVTAAPGGGAFQGAMIHASINNGGTVVFAGIVPTAAGISGNLGMGIFRADTAGAISNVAGPGDPAPGGGTFDFAENPWINDRGDVAFGAHVAGEECVGGGDQSVRIFCAESVYLKRAHTGEILSIAHQGGPAPGGGIYRLAFGPVMNNRGDIVFVGDLTPAPEVGRDLAIFLFSGGKTLPVARPGDSMPGGGHLASAEFFVATYFLNNRGEVAFTGVLDTRGMGLYAGRPGSLELVTKTGATIPGVGTIADLGSVNVPAAIINDHGQVLFWASLTDGRSALLLATP